MTIAQTLINDNCQTFRLTFEMSTLSSAGLDVDFVQEVAKRTNIARCLSEYMESAKKYNIMVELTMDIKVINGNGFKAVHESLEELARHDDHENIEYSPYPGDVVMLNSGGQKMVVAAHFVNDGFVTCDWMDIGGSFHTSSFRRNQLVAVGVENK